MNNYEVLAKNYVQMGKEYLTEELGSFKGYVTVIDTYEDETDSEFRLNLKENILKEEIVNRCWWQEENYGYRLCIEF